MQVSAINFNTAFKGYDEDEEITEMPIARSHHRTLEETTDKIDFDKLANGIKEVGKTDKKTTPTKYCFVSLLLGAGTFVATKKFSHKTFKAITSKLALDEPLNKTAKTISEKLGNMKELKPVTVTNTKTFFENSYHRISKWFAEVTEKFGNAGLTAEEKTGQNASALCVRNAIRKAASIALATGVSCGVITEQYKDSDNNNIPDKLENVCNGAKTTKSILGIINDAILD